MSETPGVLGVVYGLLMMLAGYGLFLAGPAFGRFEAWCQRKMRLGSGKLAEPYSRLVLRLFGCLLIVGGFAAGAISLLEIAGA